jgi:SulP family sulfate permease
VAALVGLLVYLQGLPVGAGFSASSANYEAGGHSRWTGLVAAAAIALALGLAQGALALVPLPVLCAVVIGILSHKLGPRPLWATLRHGHHDESRCFC